MNVIIMHPSACIRFLSDETQILFKGILNIKVCIFLGRLNTTPCNEKYDAVCLKDTYIQSAIATYFARVNDAGCMRNYKTLFID
jgi:hypothetical protein